MNQTPENQETLPLTEFRRQVGEYVNQVYYAGKSLVLTKGEKKVAALVPITILERLAELEEFYAQTLTDRNGGPAQAAIESDQIAISEHE